MFYLADHFILVIWYSKLFFLLWWISIFTKSYFLAYFANFERKITNNKETLFLFFDSMFYLNENDFVSMQQWDWWKTTKVVIKMRIIYYTQEPLLLHWVSVTKEYIVVQELFVEKSLFDGWNICDALC